jgi:hypothetical protein
MQMVMPMRANGKMIRLMDMEHIFMQMGQAIQESGPMI